MIPAIIIILFIVWPLYASPTSESHTQDVRAGSATECRKVAKVLGFAAVDVNDMTALAFFTKPDSSEAPALTVRLFHDQAINSINHRVEGAAAFRPSTLHLDYDLLELSVLSRRQGWLKVVVDEQTHRALWMPERRDVRFVGWLSKMRDAFAVARPNQKVNQLRVKPLANARAVRLRGKDCFKVDRMHGEWIRVTQQAHCDEPASTSVRGWVRWRDKQGCLLIEIYPFA
jgi:hypothetical protein